MLNVIISDDQTLMLEKMKKIISDFVFIEEMEDIRIELVTPNPIEVLELFTPKKKVINGKEVLIPMPFKERLLFLDINFGETYAPFDGINLGFEIRKYDITSNIVFITNNTEERRDVIDQKIIPLGYLPKRLSEDEFRDKVIDLLKTARKRMYMSTGNKKIVEIKVGHGRKKYVNLADIYYIKGNENKDGDGKGMSVLSGLEGSYFLRRRLRDYANEIQELVRLGRSYLINPLNVKETRKSGRIGILTLKNGEEISVLRKSFEEYEAVVSDMIKNGML